MSDHLVIPILAQYLLVGHSDEIISTCTHRPMEATADTKVIRDEVMYELTHGDMFADGLPARKVYVRYDGKDYVCYLKDGALDRQHAEPNDPYLSLF